MARKAIGCNWNSPAVLFDLVVRLVAEISSPVCARYRKPVPFTSDSQAPAPLVLRFTNTTSWVVSVSVVPSCTYNCAKKSGSFLRKGCGCSPFSVLFDFPTWEGASFLRHRQQMQQAHTKRSHVTTRSHVTNHSEHGTNSSSGTELFCDRSILCIIRGDPLPAMWVPKGTLVREC
jgi:hypothetical protein